MNKKHLNIALFVLLIIIWGSIVYKYFTKHKDSEEVVSRDQFDINNMSKYTFAKDTFLLQITNKNPFNASIKIEKRKVAKKTKIMPKKTINRGISKTSLVWPAITYHGFVKGGQKTTRLILIKINNKLYKKREREAIGEITLTKAFNDSLIVSLNNNTKTIQKIHD